MKRFVLAFCIVFALSAFVHAQKVELEFWFGHDSSNLFAQRFTELIERFNETNPHGIHVNVHYMGTSEYRERLIVADIAGTGPDVAHMWTHQLGPLAVSGLLLDIYSVVDEDRVREAADLAPGALEMVSYQGGLYGLPLSANTYGLIYNGDHFDEAGIAGPPGTVEELDRYAQMLTRTEPDGTLIHMGYYPDDFYRLFWGWVFGGEYYDPVAQRYTVDHPGIVAALEWVVSYHDRYGLANINNFRAALGSPAAGAGPLTSGLYSMLTIGQFRIETLRTVRPETDWRFAPLPSIPGGPKNVTLIEADAAAVMASTRHPKEAVEFLLWLGSTEVLSERVKYNSLIPHRGISKYDYHPDYHMWLELTMSPNARSVPITPISDSFSTVFGNQFRRALRGEERPAVVLAEANRLLNIMLDEALGR